MPHLGFVIIVATTAAGFVALFLWALRRATIEAREVKSAWQSYAERRQLKWVDPGGPWYARRSYTLRGTLDGVPLIFERFVVSTGKSSVRYTRVRAELARNVPARLIVCRKKFMNRLNYAFQEPLIDIGGDGLLVRCASDAFARTVVDDRLRDDLLATPKNMFVECRDSQAKVWWLGSERDPEVLDRGAGMLVRVVRAIRV